MLFNIHQKLHVVCMMLCRAGDNETSACVGFLIKCTHHNITKLSFSCRGEMEANIWE